jgi:hypothetical protein
MAHESEYGNRMMHAEMQNSAVGKAEFGLEYKITRRDYAQRKRTEQKPSLVSALMSPRVAPDIPIPTDGKIKEPAVEVTGSQNVAIGLC